MLFIKLTASNGRDDAMWLNVEQIFSIQPDIATNGSILLHSNAAVIQPIRVKETPEEILSYIPLTGN